MVSKRICYFGIALLFMSIVAVLSDSHQLLKASSVSAEVALADLPSSTTDETAQSANSADAADEMPFKYHFPIVRLSSPSALFSIGGVGTEAQVLQVVPEGAQIDPYIWDALPHRGSSIQVIRACTYYHPKSMVEHGGTAIWAHNEWYHSYKVGHLCWDPITKQVAKIVDDARCPHGIGKPCLDVESDAIPNVGESELRALIVANPTWTWLVGNEPDGYWQDALLQHTYLTDGTHTRLVEIGGPKAYATFYKDIYELMNEASTLAPKLVFCQATFAHDQRANAGLDYCRQAYYHLKQMGYGPEHIYALSTHQYAHDGEMFNGQYYGGGQLLAGDVYPYGDGRSVLDLAVEKWIEYLEQFESWAASEGMGDKPLWLTEYGSLAAWCYEAQSDNAYEEGGVACPEADDGQRLYPFYGRNSREGIWGLQTLQMEYLARSDNQWKASWWFVSTMGWGSGTCFQTGWLWRADFDCEIDSNRVNNLSRAGETHYQVLSCLVYSQNCPKAGERSQDNLTQKATAGANAVKAPEPHCKSFGDFVCPRELE